MWLFLFGAGASAGARHPSPPLGHQLHEYVRRYLEEAEDKLSILEEPQDGIETDQVRQELKEYLHSAQSYESLVDKLRVADEPLVKKLNLLMAYSLSPPINDDPKVDDEFVEKPDEYDELLRIVGTGPQTENIRRGPPCQARPLPRGAGRPPRVCGTGRPELTTLLWSMTTGTGIPEGFRSANPGRAAPEARERGFRRTTISV